MFLSEDLKVLLTIRLQKEQTTKVNNAVFCVDIKSGDKNSKSLISELTGDSLRENWTHHFSFLFLESFCLQSAYIYKIYIEGVEGN